MESVDKAHTHPRKMATRSSSITVASSCGRHCLCYFCKRNPRESILKWHFEVVRNCVHRGGVSSH